MASGLALSVVSSLILTGGKKPDQQRSFILSVWQSGKSSPVVHLWVCVCFAWGNGSGRREEGFWEPVLQCSWASCLPVCSTWGNLGLLATPLGCCQVAREVGFFSSMKETSLSERNPSRTTKHFLLTSVI